jgi:hypothetical protein
LLFELAVKNVIAALIITFTEKTNAVYLSSILLKNLDADAWLYPFPGVIE